MDSLRLDIWLDVTCLFRTRSEAQKACRGGKIEVNGATAKPHRELRVGDALTIGRPLGRVQQVIVRSLQDTHIAKAAARELYEDVTPPPTAEQVEARQIARLMRPFLAAANPGTPDKRQRREIRRMKGRG